MAYQGHGYTWKKSIEPHTIVKLRLGKDCIGAQDEKTNLEFSVPDGAQIIVLQIMEDEDALHRFKGLWRDQILSFYLFDSEIEVVFG